jgi:predicted metal-dependent hydrolase|tara:strand:+ start:2550 stop:3122 length:573 start_codon:yes stop_codon:yes gene_type:complete
MNELALTIILIILILVFFMHYESKYSELTYVTSTIDKQQYLVRNREDKVEAANILATIKRNLVDIVAYLEKNNMSDPKVRRLVQKYRPSKISESVPNTNYTSYSVNKGEKIVFCIRSKKTHKLVDINTMMFVAIHELAHVMTKSVGHTEEFWDNMKYLLKKGIKTGIYKAVDYKKKPVPYCGTEITDSPL